MCGDGFASPDKFPSNLAKSCALSLRADEAEPQRLKESRTERPRLSAHQAAQPQEIQFQRCVVTKVTTDGIDFAFCFQSIKSKETFFEGLIKFNFAPFENPIGFVISLPAIHDKIDLCLTRQGYSFDGLKVIKLFS
jgi:hypothetical protein